jgi:hypothetical protein
LISEEKFIEILERSYTKRLVEQRADGGPKTGSQGQQISANVQIISNEPISNFKYNSAETIKTVKKPLDL